MSSWKTAVGRGEIAVLARTNAQLVKIEQELKNSSVDFKSVDLEGFLSGQRSSKAQEPLELFRRRSPKNPCLWRFPKIISALGWKSRANKDEKWLALNWFLEVLKSLMSRTLDEYLRELDERERSGHEPLRDAVMLATIHGTKGLEFAKVFLIGVNQNYFPQIGYVKDGS